MQHFVLMRYKALPLPKNTVGRKQARRMKGVLTMLKDIQKKSLTDEEMSQVSGGSMGNNILRSGKVVAVFPNATFHVELADGSVVEADLSGKLRLAYVKIRVGDKVTVKISPDDLSKGTIVVR